MGFEQTPINVYASGLDGDGSFLDFVAIVDDYETLQFQHGSYFPGAFTITINKNTLYALEFQRKRIIQLGSDTTKCGVIEEVTSEVGPDGAASEIITVKGRELTSYLDRRIMVPPAGQAYYSLASSTPAETVIKTAVYDQLGAGATDADRRDANLTIETDLAQGDAYVLSSRYDSLLQVVSNCALATFSTAYVYLNHTTKKWVLAFTLGIDRTTGQTTNEQAVFSTSRETVLTATLKDTEQSYKNMAYVGGQGEGAARTIVTVPTSEPTGIDRREMFVDARDLTLTPSLENRGLQKLSENQYVKFISSDVLAYSQLIYGTNYNVGDKVTIEQFGETNDVYVTSAEESWKKGAYNLKVGFDRSAPTLTNQVSSILNQTTKTLNATEIAQSLTPSASPTFVGLTLTGLTASQAVQTNGSKALISIANTGTGNNVLATSPTISTPTVSGGTFTSPALVTPNIGAATGTSLQLSGLTASQAVQTDASKNLVTIANTGTGSNVLADTPTITTLLKVSATTGSAALPSTISAATLVQLGAADSGSTAIELFGWAGAPTFIGRRAGGTVASPSATPDDVNITRLAGFGYDSGGYTTVTNAHISLMSNEAWTSGGHGTRIVFATTTNGTTTAAERWRIDDSGNFSNKTSSISAYIHLKAGVATASGAPLKFDSGTNLTSAESGAVEWDGTKLYITQSSGPTRRIVVLADTAATATSTPADPTGTTNTTGLMMGLAGSITPVNSTRILVTISGQMANTTVNDGATVQLRTGTGTAPTNGAASTGTQRGASQTMTSLVAAQRSGFSISAVVTGLTLGTAYWIDARLAAVTGGTANIFGVTISAVEV